MTTATRTVATAKAIVAPDSMGGIDGEEYLSRLEAAIREWDDVTEDTEVSVFFGDAGASVYEGLYSDSQPWEYTALTDRLHNLAEHVFSEMCRGR